MDRRRETLMMRFALAQADLAYAERPLWRRLLSALRRQPVAFRTFAFDEHGRVLDPGAVLREMYAAYNPDVT